MASATSAPVVNENQEIAQPTTATPVVESSDKLNVPSAEGENQGGDFAVKHPLHHAWTFWYDTPGKKKNQQSWGKSLKELITVTTVEDFWGVYNNIVKASELANGGNYHFFRNGIKPEWEDVANAHGGGWKVQFHKRSAVDIDETWLYALLACIGEAFQEEDEICGIVFSTRREFFRISLWTRTSVVRETAENIGKQFKLSLNTTEKLEFTPHHDSDDKNMYFSI